jgi:hypothetical protein
MAIGLIGCGKEKHEHTFTEATCTLAKTCSDCGFVEGEALGHNYSDATCTSPSKCKRCGDKKGNAVGHSTTLGYCSRCKGYQGLATYNKFYEYGTESMEYWGDVVDYILIFGTTSSDRYTAMVYTKPYAEDCKEEFVKLYDLCKGEPALKSACSRLKKIIDKMPTSNDAYTYIEQVYEVNSEIMLWVDEFSTLAKKVAA